jgi:mannose-6-phosphate isomerase-like protein (cupin superfamily)
MPKEPIIAQPGEAGRAPISAAGGSFEIHEWRGSGPATLHVHHEDDEAWHVLEGTMRFRFADREIEVGPGATVFVPAGVAHTFTADNARYLIILTPRLSALIQALHQARERTEYRAVYRRYASELLEDG